MMCSFLRRELYFASRHWQVADVSVLRQAGRYLPGEELERLRKATLYGVFRRGKHLAFSLDGGDMLVCHNAMSGYWDMEDRPWTFDYVEGKREASERDVRVKIRITPMGPDSVSERTLRFHDARLFGSLRHHRGKDWTGPRALEAPLLGPEALLTSCSRAGTPEWTVDDLILAAGRHGDWPVKRALMDQGSVAGVGNIYATEVLWYRGIRPDRRLDTLNDGQLAELHGTVGYVLRAAVATHCDYSFLCCYRKQECKRCRHKMQKIEVAGRSSYFCPKCQT